MSGRFIIIDLKSVVKKVDIEKNLVKNKLLNCNKQTALSKM